jgi:hypothetical protein
VGLSEAVMEDGSLGITIKDIGDFYPDVEPVVLLSNVKNIKRSYKEDLFYNQCNIGYREGGGESSGGIDDCHYDITLASILKTIGTKFEQLSECIAASLIFEQARRLSEKQTEDYKFDNSTFILSVHNDGASFKPETDERFTDVTNLIDGNHRYNKAITPGRNFRRWLKWVSMGLFQYIGSAWTFTGGQGNYKMGSTMTDGCVGDVVEIPVVENSNVESVKGYFTPNAYEIEHVLTEQQFQNVVEHRHIPIGISQTGSGHVPFHIFDLQFNEFEGTVKIIACPIDFFELNGNIGSIPAADDGGVFDITFGDEFN